MMERDVFRALDAIRGVVPASDYAAVVMEIAAARVNDNELWRALSRDFPPEGVEIAGKAYKSGDVGSLVRFVANLGEPGLAGLWSFVIGRTGQLFTPQSVVTLMLKLLRVNENETFLDPACRFGEFLASRENTSTRPRQAVALTMNEQLVAWHHCQVQGVAADVALPPQALVPFPKFDVVATNPPFNESLPDTPFYANRVWRYGDAPQGKANYAWLQLAAESLTMDGRAAVLMPSAAASAQYKERLIREQLVNNGCVSAVIALPDRLFEATAIPANIWLLRSPEATMARREVLLIDASSLGERASVRTQKMTEESIAKVTGSYLDWLDGHDFGEQYAVAVSFEELARNDYRLTPSAYVTSAMVGSPAELSGQLDRLALAQVRANAVDERAAAMFARISL
jgi:type I restriction-modification system DNA methylase subunit